MSGEIMGNTHRADYRERIIKMLMCDIDTRDLEFIYGATRGACIDAIKRKKSGKHTRPELSRKLQAVKFLMRLDESDWLFIGRIWMMLKRHIEIKEAAQYEQNKRKQWV